MPAGFREGVTVRLYNEAGNYTGSLQLSSTVRDHPNDDTMRLLGACQTIVGCASDWWQEVDAEDVQGLRVALTGPRHYRVLSNRDDELRALFESRVVRLLPLSLADVPALSFLVRGQSSVVIRARHLFRHGS